MTQISQDIARKLIKVKLTISCWTARKMVRDVAAEVARQHEAESDAVGTVIYILPDRYASPITTAVSKLRSYWNDNTLPWEDDAWRIVPAAQYQKLMDGAIELKREFYDAVEDLTTNYADAYESAEVRLGDLFRPGEFPSVDNLKDKYGIKIQQDTVTLATDVRINDISDDIIANVQESVTQQYQQNIREVVSSMISRVKSVIEDIVARTDKAKERAKYSTLIKKIKKTCDSLDSLNITQDPLITKLVQQLRGILDKADDGLLSVNGSLREDVHKEASDMLNALNNYKG